MAQEITPAPTTFHLPEGMAYSCHNEGVCCNTFDTIPLDDHAADSLARLDLAALNSLAHNPSDAPVAIPNPAAPPPQKIARKPCGACTMLTEENLCAIHAVAGEPAKPRVCQDFPWRFIETPGGTYVGLSFVCPSVRANRGTPLADQQDELPHRHRQSASLKSIPATLPLNPRVNISWQDYLHLEQAMMDILALDSTDLPTRLIALCLLPAFTDQMLVQAGSSGDITLADIVQAMQASGYSPLLKVARKSVRPNPRSRRMFLGMFTSFANTLHQKDRGRFITVLGVMTQYIRHASGLGSVRLQPFPVPLGHRALDAAILPNDGPDADRITRYLRHCIWRKDLLLSGDITRRTRMLALNAALIGCYAAAVSSDASSAPVISPADEAIGHVEKLYGFHSAFYRFFEQNRIFADIVDSFLLKPSFPYILFR